MGKNKQKIRKKGQKRAKNGCFWGIFEENLSYWPNGHFFLIFICEKKINKI